MLDLVTELSKHLESRPDVKGGAPVIKGTRITTSAILKRIQGGESIEDIASDYDYIDLEALLNAAMWEAQHPTPPAERPPRPAG